MKAKRILTALLAAAIAVSAVSCGNDSGGTSSGGTSSAGTAPSGSASSGSAEKGADYATAEEILARDFSEKITITVASIQVDEAKDYNKGDPYVTEWTDQFNIEWDITALSWDSWQERLNTWINADDLPDMSVWNFNAGDALNYADQGLVKELPSDWKETYPNLAESAKWTEFNQHYEELLGGTYYMFRPVFANNFPAEKITSHMSVMIRTDWGEEAGYDLSKNLETTSITISELFDYCRAVKANADHPATFYPNYTRASNLFNGLDQVSSHSGVAQNPFYLGSDDQYHWGPGEDETGVKETLRMFKQAYDEGLIYPEFYTLQEPDDQGHFYASGDSASVIAEGMAIIQDRYTTYMQENLGLNFWDVATELVLTDDEGVWHGDAATNYWCCNIFSPNIKDETLERLLTIMDYSCTEKGQHRLRMGIEGTDYNYDESGNLVNLLPEGKTAADLYAIHPIYGNLFVLTDDFSFINPSFTQEARDKAALLYNVRSERTNQPDEPDWFLLNYSSQALNLASMTYYDEYANLITKSGDFDANYSQWVSDKMSVIQPVLDDLNKQYQEQK